MCTCVSIPPYLAIRHEFEDRQMEPHTWVQHGKLFTLQSNQQNDMMKSYKRNTVNYIHRETELKHTSVYGMETELVSW